MSRHAWSSTRAAPPAENWTLSHEHAKHCAEVIAACVLRPHLDGSEG
jgi:hypothetical protein